MSSALEPRAGATVTGLFLGSLAIAGAVALVTAPITPRIAAAQSVSKSPPRETGSVDGRGVSDRIDAPDHRTSALSRQIVQD